MQITKPSSVKHTSVKPTSVKPTPVSQALIKAPDEIDPESEHVYCYIYILHDAYIIIYLLFVFYRHIFLFPQLQVFHLLRAVLPLLLRNQKVKRKRKNNGKYTNNIFFISYS